ncbi:MAG: bifunctional oligoribonuclease/PAP phosphatase NrnA, partial [Firmicutes bacterium]|nr:bifunctional oligoribonuclease/PAP phosphatase NrnA [Bacillota bacterium]
MQIPLKILETIKEAKHIAIFSHKLPDGDSVGASLALGLGLQKLGKEVKLYTIDPVPRKYRFLKGSDRFLTDFVLTDRDILAIILDCSDLERIEPFKEQLKNIKTINIDHHSTNGYFGALNFVDPQASATGEIVFFLLQELGVELDEDIANALYVALTTDTGSFKYENTTARTFSVAASLSKYGIAPAFIAMKVFEERPLSAICLLAKALGTLQFAHNKKIAYLSVTENMMRECQATAEDLDGIIYYA